MATVNAPDLDAALQQLLASGAFLPRPNTPAVSNAGMFPSPQSPYNSMSDQITDAFKLSGTIPGRPINTLGGNAVPRYGFSQAPANVGGANWGASAYTAGGFNPYAGRGNGIFNGGTPGTPTPTNPTNPAPPTTLPPSTTPIPPRTPNPGQTPTPGGGNAPYQPPGTPPTNPDRPGVGGIFTGTPPKSAPAPNQPGGTKPVTGQPPVYPNPKYPISEIQSPLQDPKSGQMDLTQMAQFIAQQSDPAARAASRAGLEQWALSQGIPPGAIAMALQQVMGPDVYRDWSGQAENAYLQSTTFDPATGKWWIRGQEQQGTLPGWTSQYMAAYK